MHWLYCCKILIDNGIQVSAAFFYAFGENVTVINHDNYYKAHNDMTYEERAALNYDHPNAFDTDLMIEHCQEKVT